MPVIPTFVSEATISPSRDTVTPAVARAPDLAITGDRLAASFGRVTDAFTGVADKARAVREADEATTHSLAGAERLQQLQEQFSRDTAPDASDRYQAAVLAARQEIGDAVGSPGARRLVMDDFDRRAVNTYVQTRRMQAAFQQHQAQISLQDNLHRLSRLAAASGTGEDWSANVEAARRAVAAAEVDGVIGAGEAGRYESRFLAQAEETRLRGLLAQDPAAARAALSDPEQFQHIDPVRRQQLEGRVGRVGARRQRQQSREQGRRVSEITDEAFRVAAADGTAGADTEPDAAMASMFGGDPTDDDPAETALDALEAQRDLMPPGEYRAARRALEAPIEQSDAAFEAALRENAHLLPVDEFRREAARGVEDGRLTAQAFTDLTALSGEVTADTPAARSWRSGRGAVTRLLASPPEEAGGTLLQGPLASAQSGAIQDFDEWRRANPEATPQEAEKHAAELAQVWRGSVAARARAEMPQPYGFTGWGDAIDADVVAGAEEALIGALERGEIGEADAAREARILGAWRWLMGPEARESAGYQPMTFRHDSYGSEAPTFRNSIPQGRGTGPMPRARVPAEDARGREIRPQRQTDEPEEREA